MRSLNVVVVIFACSIMTPAFADRGALSADVGAGLVRSSLSAAYVTSGHASGGAIAAWGGVRYAFENWFEVSGSGFYEPPVDAWHNQVDVSTTDGVFPGSLTHRVSRYGALIGARYVHGMVWRFSAGIEVGLSRRMYSGFRHVNNAESRGAFDYGLKLNDTSLTNFVVAPLVGFEWAGGDHWSISVVPRFSFLLGESPTLAVSVPIVFSWSWYL